jgi:hypothetical protein
VLSVVSTTEAISAARAADGTISATNVKTTYDSRFTVRKRKANYFCCSFHKMSNPGGSPNTYLHVRGPIRTVD